MGVMIDTIASEPNPAVFFFLSVACLLSIFLLPYFSRSGFATSAASSFVFDHATPSVPFRRFQLGFLLLYSLASSVEGLSSVSGEFEFSMLGVNKEQIVSFLCVVVVASLTVSTFFGILSNTMGQKKFVVIFFFLHIFVGVLKRVSRGDPLWLASIYPSLASSIFTFSFEAWMVLEHEKQGLKEELLNDIFWLMMFLGSGCFITTHRLSNWLISTDARESLTSPSIAAICLAALGIAFVVRRWKRYSQAIGLLNHDISYTLLFKDEGFFISRGLIYPCLKGARMLGSTIFPWHISVSMSFRTEDCLAYAFMISGFVFSVVAYDYQEIGVLLILFCLLHACMGTILPSLARLRTMYVPNHLRAGMIGSSLALSNAALLLFMVQRGYYHSIGNSTTTAFAAIALFSAAGFMHALKRPGKQPYRNGHKL